jgi:hypothetical protein
MSMASFISEPLPRIARLPRPYCDGYVTAFQSLARAR